ncbi:hypothetical protein D477_020643 [Arthrobacter crystallopoietes BAB-32]|uniref:Antitoxin FitA-like ribbon-helix-helix domain-containing protein n=1 Tax=Arthrobacter crystallopoietes BAB-32 TaxID=1246476 RepID=N1UX00_9MICC|nr:hypothetical protein [Arthrobacter crystallopoietes]EMY32342.1 hypothetical protein D477_020643 [Arthrobacter crystallopoietes BAB-32]
MAVTITIRHVPEDVRARLADKAARSGQSLQEYLSSQLRHLAFRPSPVDFVQGLQGQDMGSVSIEDILAAKEADRR